MKNGLLRGIGKVHVKKAHVTRQLHIAHRAVGLRYLPGPQAGVMVTLSEIALLVVGGVDQSDRAVILLGRLVHQGKNPLGARQGHNHRC